ncbi:hypothetical protein DAPPUDRAFT_100105 [Daphnia pulex]|uniref:Outer membrane protein beta-barrel domain-containing protein n=1 Tax=Daphnia pulex TaxID=6669 RepID=E9G9C1_DAPPU|nr:hypothetical protein DAPPUDRAFT_100105 [Daphnia pulex]|eukprot:EFX83909.1 hypothetical protein DAPPUDRAFT_100105 [Daphnia pulex]
MTNKVKIALLSLGFLGSSAFADYKPHLWGTFGIGMTSNTTHTKTLLPNLLNGDQKDGLTNLSGAGLIRLGLGLDIQKFHAGLFFYLPGNKTKGSTILDFSSATRTNTLNTRVKSDFLGYGGGLRLGYKMDKNLLFASFGALSRLYKTNLNLQTNNLTTGVSTDSDWISEKKNFTAFVPGIGLEYALSPCIVLGMQASVELYASKTIESDGDTAETGLGSSIKVRPRTFSGLLTASYKFNL